MRHNRLLGLLICALLPLFAFAQQRKPRPITFDTDTPFVHDPVMAYEDGVYYAFYTGWNIGCMTSTDVEREARRPAQEYSRMDTR